MFGLYAYILYRILVFSKIIDSVCLFLPEFVNLLHAFGCKTVQFRVLSCKSLYKGAPPFFPSPRLDMTGRPH